MNRTIKKVLISLTIVLLLVGGIWYFMVTSYTPELTTENEIELTDHSDNLTNQSNDLLFNSSFSTGQDNLEWSKVTMSIVSSDTRLDCTKSGFTSGIIHDGDVQSRLNADGNSFTVEVDADSDDFIMINFEDMQQTNDSDFDLKFSKTDIFLGPNVTGIALNDNFQDVNSIPTSDFDESADERLEWYDYDLSIHRVIPKEITYVVNDSSIHYKIQFLSYYNSKDESRHVSFIISTINNSYFPATNNDNLIKIAPCVITSSNESFWQHNETILVSENGIDICNDKCTIKVEIRYLNQIITGMKEIELN